MKMAKTLEGLLSMAQRAGKVASGGFVVEEAVAKGKAELILIASDSAAETKEKFSGLAEKHNIKAYEVLDKDRLGQCLGKEFRAVAALLDKGFSKEAEKRIISEQ